MNRACTFLAPGFNCAIATIFACVSFGLYATGQLIFVKKMAALYMLPLMVSHISNAAAVVTVPLGNASGSVTWKLLVAFFNLNLHHLHHSNVNSV